MLTWWVSRSSKAPVSRSEFFRMGSEFEPAAVAFHTRRTGQPHRCLANPPSSVITAVHWRRSPGSETALTAATSVVRLLACPAFSAMVFSGYMAAPPTICVACAFAAALIPAAPREIRQLLSRWLLFHSISTSTLSDKVPAGPMATP